MLLTIVGSSCSGKTTAARACADLPNLVIHDFDEIGVPSNADLQWRQRSLEAWLRRVLDYQAAGLDVLLTGQSPLGEVLATPSAVNLNGIAAALLDVSDAERLRRLEHRDPGKWPTETKNRFLGWANWLRAHATDPNHAPEVLTQDAWPEMAWHRWNPWTPDHPDWEVTIIDTTNRTKQESAAAVRQWATTAQTNPPKPNPPNQPARPAQTPPTAVQADSRCRPARGAG